MSSFQIEGPLQLESFPDKQCATYLSATKEPAFFYKPFILSTPSIINILGEKQNCAGSLFFIVRRSDDKTILSQKKLYFEGFMEQQIIHQPLDTQLDLGILCQDCEHKDTFDLLSLEHKDYIPPPPPPIPILPTLKQTHKTQLETITNDLAQRMKQKKNDDDVTMKSIRIYKHLEVDIPSSHHLHTPDSQPLEPLPDTTPPEPHIASPETQPEVPPETQPEVSPETQPEVSPDTQPEVSPDTQPEVSPETQPEVSPETQPEVLKEVIPEEVRSHIKVVVDAPAQILKMDQSTDVLLPALSMDELKGRFSMRISQLYVSKALQVFGKRLLQRYSLSEYKNQQDSTIFYGCCTQQDYLSISQHRGVGIILWSGPDSMLVSRVPAFVDFLKKASNLYHIAYSAAIEKDLKDLGLRYLYLPVTPMIQDKIFSPTKKGTAVYVYSQPTLSSFYKMDLIKKIQDRLPETPFVFSIPPDPSLTQPILKNNIISAPYSFMPSFYENCFVGLRLTEHDGISCSVQEMALMGRKTIHNDCTPGCLTYTDEDSIVQAILEEQKTIGTTDYDLAHKTQQMIQEADFYILHLLSPISVLGRLFTLKWDGSHPSDYKWEHIINATSSLLIRRVDHQWIIEFIQDQSVRIIGRIKNIDLLPPESGDWMLTSLP